MKSLGWDLLRNEHRIIEKDGDRLEIVGLRTGVSRRFLNMET